MSLSIPYKDNAERGKVQNFAEFTGQHIGEKEAEQLAQQFNEGFRNKEYTTWSYRSDLSPKGEEDKKK